MPRASGEGAQQRQLVEGEEPASTPVGGPQLARYSEWATAATLLIVHAYQRTLVAPGETRPRTGEAVGGCIVVPLVKRLQSRGAGDPQVNRRQSRGASDPQTEATVNLI